MHELAICQEMLSLVSRIAAERGATRIDRIVVIIGPLSGVEVPLLQRAFSVARAGTPAANAALESEICGVRVRCRTCGVTSGASVSRLTCGRCGDWRVDLQQGDEMLLKTVELSGMADGAGQQVPAAQPPTVH